MLLNTFKIVFYKIWVILLKVKGHINKQRSLYAMEELDEHLLDDIGFRREGGELIPLDNKRYTETIRNQQRQVRLKSALLKRHRGRLKARGSGG